VLDQLSDTVPCHPQQIEFARLNLTYAVMSKRKLIELVENHLVDGWDDPRMTTLAGLRRRGYTPESIRLFAERIGVSKADSWIDMGVLEDCLAPRRITLRSPNWEHGPCPSRKSSISNATISWKPLPRATSASRRERKCGSDMPTS
jgi:hypothetical protein